MWPYSIHYSTRGWGRKGFLLFLPDFKENSNNPGNVSPDHGPALCGLSLHWQSHFPSHPIYKTGEKQDLCLP
jgi:hypothetical protein